ncbi:MAG: DUF1571 domain-containing protein [Rubripirellula sp.]
MKAKLLTAIGLIVVLGLAAMFLRSNRGISVDGAAALPTKVVETDPLDAKSEMTMADVLQMAGDARRHMAEHLDDYTARFVKQERDENGQLGEETEFEMRVQTRLRGDTEEAPLRVYLNYLAPDNVKGREVLWAQDLNDGKMVVHEVGFLLSMKRIWLDPNGVIAMQGQRYPISEIGIVRLCEKLLERGEQDRGNPDLQISLTEDHMIGDVQAQLIRVRRLKPSGLEDDFSLAEIAIDPDRQLILQYRSFGWPEVEGDDPPLLESYTYHDVEINVGLTDDDFTPDNSNYNFPAF